MRLADPDSAARLFLVDTMHAVESTPTFRWRNVKATVRQLGDSVWIEAPHWDPRRRVARREDHGARSPRALRDPDLGRPVSLNDVAWVYPTLPRTGGGTMILDIKNERNLKQLDYAITEMDVRTTKSRLLGDITFEVGGPVLAVHDVKLRADPVDFDLLRALNGKPFPADWQGTITGTVNARRAADEVRRRGRRHVPRQARAGGRVEAEGAGRARHPVRVHGVPPLHRRPSASTCARVAIYPAFPRVTGIVSGSAVLDSSWLDVRCRTPTSRTPTVRPSRPGMTGGGRITYGEKFMGYDLAPWQSRCRSRRSAARIPCCRFAARSPDRSPSRGSRRRWR